MNTFMKRAVEIALNNVRVGGQPFGAVLVKDNEIISEGMNELHLKYDISGHAELLAIRRAQEKLQTNDLTGFTMYASGYPCPMCYTAMYFAGIRDIYFCASLDDAVEAGLGISGVIYGELSKENMERTVTMKQMKLGENVEDPMKSWKTRGKE